MGRRKSRKVLLAENSALADACRVLATKYAEGKRPVFTISAATLNKASKIDVEIVPAKNGGVRVAVIPRGGIVGRLNDRG